MFALDLGENCFQILQNYSKRKKIRSFFRSFYFSSSQFVLIKRMKQNIPGAGSSPVLHLLKSKEALCS